MLSNSTKRQKYTGEINHILKMSLVTAKLDVVLLQIGDIVENREVFKCMTSFVTDSSWGGSTKRFIAFNIADCCLVLIANTIILVTVQIFKDLQQYHRVVEVQVHVFSVHAMSCFGFLLPMGLI